MKQTVYVFDVDGVFNDLKRYTPDDRILDIICQQLRSNTYIAINTGRGYEWIDEHILQPIAQRLNSANHLDNLFAAVEMGGLGIFYLNGEQQLQRSAFSLLPNQVDAVRNMFEQDTNYQKVMHWYAKQTMATLAKNHDTPLEQFVPVQKEVTIKLSQLFADQHVTVANSTDAVDVHAPEAGKWAGGQLVFEWVGSKTALTNDHFICFGDSSADYEMARFFASQSHDVTFVCTNPKLEVKNADSEISFVSTDAPFNNGAYQYLSSLV